MSVSLPSGSSLLQDEMYATLAPQLVGSNSETMMPVSCTVTVTSKIHMQGWHPASSDASPAGEIQC